VGDRLDAGDVVGVTDPKHGGGLSLRGVRRRLSTPFWRRPWLRTTALLLPATAWMAVIYLAALAALFVSAFWTLDVFTSKIVHHWNVDNFRLIFESDAYRRVIYRTIGIAAAVTATTAFVAFPFA
jgi:putative spermidine/putrescine transport system permease protein